MRIELLEEVDSTNDYVKKYLEGGENVVVCAERQSKGRGTKGRSFLSEKGGVYLSALIFHEDLLAADAFRVMAHAAVSVCETVLAFGAKPQIKWPNDILLGGKKCCGILIENILSGDRIRASIVGIGLDVVNDLSDLKEIARSLSNCVDNPPTVEEVRDALIMNFCKPSTFSRYLSFIDFLGQEITVVRGEERFSAVAHRILSDGRLEIRREGTLQVLSAAEISIRLSL